MCGQPEAWNTTHTILQAPGTAVEARLFAATTLKGKVGHAYLFCASMINAPRRSPTIFTNYLRKPSAPCEILLFLFFKHSVRDLGLYGYSYVFALRVWLFRCPRGKTYYET